MFSLAAHIFASRTRRQQECGWAVFETQQKHTASWPTKQSNHVASIFSKTKFYHDSHSSEILFEECGLQTKKELYYT